jgi:predicted GIY-YIG superfamily endonuclease
MYFVYILVCRRTRRTYVGQTDNLVRRYRMHCDGSTRTTREKLVEPVVAYWESHPNRSSAMRRERYFKAGSGHRLKSQIASEALEPIHEQKRLRSGECQREFAGEVDPRGHGMILDRVFKPN